MTTQSETYEPPIVQGIASAAVAIGGLVLAGVSLVLFVAPPEWLTGWLRVAPLPFIFFGWLLAIRFTRHDRQIAAKVATLQMDCEDYEVEVGRLEGLVTTLTEDTNHLRNLLSNPPKSITITDRHGERIVPVVARDASWGNALRLAGMCSDYGVLPGREPSGLSQDDQADALRVLERANLVVQRGTIYRLTVTRQRAIDALNAITPPLVNPDVNLEPTSYLEPESSGWVVAGEAS